MHLMHLVHLVPVQWQSPSFMLSRCNRKVLTALEAPPSRQGCSGGTRSVLSEVLKPSLLRVAPLPHPSLTRPLLWEGDIVESAKHSILDMGSKGAKQVDLQLANPWCAQVNEIKGQASDLMSALKSSDWHYAVLT